MDFVGAHHGVGHAIEVERRRLILQFHLNNTRPVAAFHETRHRALHQFIAFPAPSWTNSPSILPMISWKGVSTRSAKLRLTARIWPSRVRASRMSSKESIRSR